MTCSPPTRPDITVLMLQIHREHRLCFFKFGIPPDPITKWFSLKSNEDQWTSMDPIRNRCGLDRNRGIPSGIDTIPTGTDAISTDPVDVFTLQRMRPAIAMSPGQSLPILHDIVSQGLHFAWQVHLADSRLLRIFTDVMFLRMLRNLHI